MKGKQIIEGIADYDKAVIERNEYRAKGFNAEVKLGDMVYHAGIGVETWELHIN